MSKGLSTIYMVISDHTRVGNSRISFLSQHFWTVVSAHQCFTATRLKITVSLLNIIDVKVNIDVQKMRLREEINWKRSTPRCDYVLVISKV